MNTTGATVEVCQGGCLRRAVRYEMRGAIQASSVCHCNSCRKASAAPAVAWVTTMSLDAPEASAPSHETWLMGRLQWAMVNPLLGHFPRGTHLGTLLGTNLGTTEAIA